MEKDIKIISGTFSRGCGVIAHNTTTNKYFHLIVLADSDGKEFIEVDGKRYYKAEGGRQCKILI